MQKQRTVPKQGSKSNASSFKSTAGTETRIPKVTLLLWKWSEAGRFPAAWFAGMPR